MSEESMTVLSDRMRVVCVGVLCFLLSHVTIAQSAIPEPPVVLYGLLKGSGSLEAEVKWSGSGNSESISIPLKRKVQVDGLVYYVVHIPFETREVVGIDDLPATENVFALSREDKVYSLSVQVDGTEVELNQENSQFTYGVWSQGLVKQMDVVFGESFEEWSERLFGKLVGKEEDPDGDGRNNYAEYLYDTNPLDALSRVWLKAFALLPGGRYGFTVDTSPDYSYKIEISYDLVEWNDLTDPVEGNGEVRSFIVNPSGAEKVFYRTVAIPK